MNDITDIARCDPQKEDRFFFDANVWMYLYCPIGGYRKEVVRKYDGFLQRVLRAGSTISISSLVLSEFFNAYTRLEFHLLRKKVPSKYRSFKQDFRGSEAYKALIKGIETTVMTQMLKLSERIDDSFGEIDLEAVFKDIEESDFNDNYYNALATIENLKIVTDDYDFGTNSSAPIITANRRLLSTH